MSRQEEFSAMMAEYEEAVTEVQKNRKMFDGVLGMGAHPGNAPCHDALDKKIAALCEAVAGDPGAGQAKELLDAVYGASLKWEGPEYARLMLIAVQRHTLPVIPRLSPEERAELAAWYERSFPRRKRLPVQDEVLKALKKG